MYDELDVFGEEAVVAYCKLFIIACHPPGMTEKNHKNPQAEFELGTSLILIRGVTVVACSVDFDGISREGRALRQTYK
jgi:hypothetical protein